MADGDEHGRTKDGQNGVLLEILNNPKGNLCAVCVCYIADVSRTHINKVCTRPSAFRPCFCRSPHSPSKALALALSLSRTLFMHALTRYLSHSQNNWPSLLRDAKGAKNKAISRASRSAASTTLAHARLLCFCACVYFSMVCVVCVLCVCLFCVVCMVCVVCVFVFVCVRVLSRVLCRYICECETQQFLKLTLAPLLRLPLILRYAHTHLRTGVR